MSTLLTNEKDIIRRLKNSDESAFSLLFKTYSPVLQQFLKSFDLPIDDIEDIIQVTFLKIWENKNAIDIDQSFKNYIITIAKNDLYNQIQKNILRKRKESEIKNTIITTTELSNNELQHILEKILNNFPEKRRKVYKMSRIEGYSNGDIAQKLGITKSTVENHINNSSSTIKRILKNIGFSLILFFL